MIISITPQWRITSNSHCYQVEQHKGKRKDGKVRWEPITYHSQLQQALDSLAGLMIREIDSSDVNEIVREIRAIHEALRQKIPNLGSLLCSECQVEKANNKEVAN